MTFKVGDKVKRIASEYKGMIEGDTDLILKVNKLDTIIHLSKYGRGHDGDMFELVDDKIRGVEISSIIIDECKTLDIKDISMDSVKIENGNTLGKGKRFNTDKPKVELLVPEAMLEEAKVWTFGSKKYDDHNWRKGISIASILACILRHTFAIMKGEDIDPESGCMHAAHIQCNCSMLIYFYKTDQYKDLDDRYKREDSNE